MNKIIRDVRVDQLPKEWREGLDGRASVNVIIEEIEKRPENFMTLEEIFARRTPPFRSKEEIDESIRRDRDEWD